MHNNISELIGNTPMVKINNLPENFPVIYIKLEYFNPSGSVKDRAAFNIVRNLELSYNLKKGDTLIEASSGNTAIGLAQIAAAKGYKLIVTLPESVSIERRKLLKAYGAELRLTKTMSDAVKEIEKLQKEHPEYFYINQFNNQFNSLSHYQNTAKEIIQDIPDFNYFIATAGTCGTITGVGKYLKEYNSKIKVIAIEPQDSAVISGNPPGPHQIQGIGPGFIPSILDKSVIDEVRLVTTEEAFTTSRWLAKSNGILLGISGGAALAKAIEIGKTLDKSKTIVVIAPDNGERYLSTNLYEE